MESVDFSEIFHQSSKDNSKGDPPIPENSHEWPDEWKTTYYKAYPRLPKITLDDEPPHADLFDIIKKRRSQRDFSRMSVTKRELSLLLKYSCGNTGQLGEDRHRRAHPHAHGGRRGRGARRGVQDGALGAARTRGHGGIGQRHAARDCDRAEMRK